MKPIISLCLLAIPLVPVVAFDGTNSLSSDLPSNFNNQAPASEKSSTPAPQAAEHAPEVTKVDAKLAAKGLAVFVKLKQQYPDAPPNPDYDLAPHTVDISMTGSVGGQPLLDLSMPAKVWEKLTQLQKNALVELLKSKIKDSQNNPEIYALTPPSAPAHAGEVQNIRSILDNAWVINTGHLDDAGYLVEDKVVSRGTDYDDPSKATAPIFIYANSKDDPVYNSSWDGSVSQVKTYHQKHLNDPDSVKYSDWSKVIRITNGYQVSVTFRSKNELGGYVIHDQTFTLDRNGSVTSVTNNDQ